MGTNVARVDHKVRFLGSYYSDVKLTDSVVKKMVLHSVAQHGNKVKLKLSTDGLHISKPMFSRRVPEPNYVPMKDISNIGRHVSNPSNLICVVENAVTPYVKIIMFRCSTEHEAAEYAEAFGAMKRGVILNGPTVLGNTADTIHGVDPNWMAVDGEKFSSSPAHVNNGTTKAVKVVKVTHKNGPLVQSSKSAANKSGTFRKSDEFKDNHATRMTETQTDVQVREIRMSEETHEGPVYATVNKHKKKQTEDVVDNEEVKGSESKHESDLFVTERNESGFREESNTKKKKVPTANLR